MGSNTRNHKDDVTFWFEVNSLLRKRPLRSGAIVDGRMWIIERERGRVSKTTWLLLTNAIWPASSASRTDAFARLFVHLAYVEKRRKERETIGQPNRTDARCQKIMPYQFLCRINIYSAIKLFASRSEWWKSDFLSLAFYEHKYLRYYIIICNNVFNDKYYNT